MKKIIIFAVIALLITTSAFAQTWTWNFNGWSTQGWVYQQNGGPNVNNPATNVNFNNNSPALWLPDKNTAHLDLSSIGLTNGSNSFKFSALVGFNFNTSTSELQKAGIGVRAVGASYSGVSYWYEGNSSTSERMNHNGDSTFFTNTLSSQTGCFRKENNTWDNSPNHMVRLTMYYNDPSKGVGQIWVGFEGITYTPYITTQIGSNKYAEWKVADIKIDPNTGTYYAVNRLRLGGDNSWAQPYFDDVTFTVIPEPGTLLVLGSGLGGLAGFAIRKRK